MFRSKDSRGAAAVEFALTLPLFLVLVFAILEYGWVMVSQHSLESAARAGCRAGAVVPPGSGSAADPSIDTAQTVIDSRIGPSCEQVVCEVTVTIDGDRPDQMLTCDLSRNYPPLIGLLPTPQILSASASMWLEFQR